MNINNGYYPLKDRNNNFDDNEFNNILDNFELDDFKLFDLNQEINQEIDQWFEELIAGGFTEQEKESSPVPTASSKNYEPGNPSNIDPAHYVPKRNRYLWSNREIKLFWEAADEAIKEKSTLINPYLKRLPKGLLDSIANKYNKNITDDGVYLNRDKEALRHKFSIALLNDIKSKASPSREEDPFWTFANEARSSPVPTASSENYEPGTPSSIAPPHYVPKRNHYPWSNEEIKLFWEAADEAIKSTPINPNLEILPKGLIESIFKIYKNKITGDGVYRNRSKCDLQHKFSMALLDHINSKTSPSREEDPFWTFANEARLRFLRPVEYKPPQNIPRKTQAGLRNFIVEQYQNRAKENPSNPGKDYKFDSHAFKAQFSAFMHKINSETTAGPIIPGQKRTRLCDDSDQALKRPLFKT